MGNDFLLALAYDSRMLIEKPETLEQLIGNDQLRATNRRFPQKVLMCAPQYFRIEYAINPYMRSPDGGLNVVDMGFARLQWEELRASYIRLGYKVEVIDGQPDFPDMVFCANQSFPFIDERGKKSVLLSQMSSNYRVGEVDFFHSWYTEQGYKVYSLENKGLTFEGNGDALIHFPLNLIWGGYGHRTSKDAYYELSERFGFKIVPLHLQSEYYYHLDLCMSILNPTTVVICPEAFDKPSLELIHMGFPNVIEVGSKENTQFACCNCDCPDDVHVILQRGTPTFATELRRLGFRPIEVETSEFLKAGGSVFCMKMRYF